MQVIPNHLFYVLEREWVKAAELKEGNLLRTPGGELVSVQALRYNTLEEPVTVYNFEVAVFHTYYTGESGVLVHNADYKPTEPVSGAKGSALDDIEGSGGATKGAGKGISNGMKVTSNGALDLTDDFLGSGYKDLRNGRYMSADGNRVVRMGDSDILGKHGGRLL